jgi:hypothetical protein
LQGQPLRSIRQRKKGKIMSNTSIGGKVVQESVDPPFYVSAPIPGTPPPTFIPVAVLTPLWTGSMTDGGTVFSSTHPDWTQPINSQPQPSNVSNPGVGVTAPNAGKPISVQGGKITGTIPGTSITVNLPG